MGRYTNPHTRLSELIALMSSEKYTDLDNGRIELTIRKMEEITGIPESVLRKDIEFLVSDKNAEVFIETDIEETYDEDDEDNEYKELHSAFLKMLKERKKEAADVCLGFDYHNFAEGTSQEEKPVFFTPFEKNLFAKVMHMSDFSDAVWIKDSAFSVSEEVMVLQDEIREAIKCGHPISFHYSSQDGEEDIKCLSVRSIYETLDNKRVYCVAFDEENSPLLYRLDWMTGLEVENNKKMDPLPKDAMDFLDHMWEADVSKDERLHVKIKIYNETKNIYDKIKKDTRDRKYGRLYKDEKDDNIFYYEDEVSGKNSFKKWLRRYGASVVVLEPQELAIEMYDSAVRRLEAYKKV